ncbi:hypothetical protein TNCT_350711 [Trichonephila clavata]|uniref:Uncharacterized protein n=1 Tax=Trichonephila clavata TaxID=2740835 RepID=A0A8X6L6V1_TRICU|nr:hypothetical protein TNCT_350711 [Trichonephila clavata]
MHTNLFNSVLNSASDSRKTNFSLKLFRKLINLLNNMTLLPPSARFPLADPRAVDILPRCVTPRSLPINESIPLEAIPPNKWQFTN